MSEDSDKLKQVLRLIQTSHIFSKQSVERLVRLAYTAGQADALEAILKQVDKA